MNVTTSVENHLLASCALASAVTCCTERMLYTATMHFQKLYGVHSSWYRTETYELLGTSAAAVSLS
jgi:hypothetical protein